VTWQEKDVLGIFAASNARPGQWKPVKSIWMAWGTRGSNKDFADAVERLEARGLLQANAGNSSYALTDAGYAQTSN
jgi:hypothetical protein